MTHHGRKVSQRTASLLTHAGAVTSTTTSDLKDILKDLSDPLIPVRASGLVALRKLVLCKDPTIEHQLDKVVDIFLTQLQDTER